MGRPNSLALAGSGSRRKKTPFQTMGRSSPLVMEESDLEEGKPGR